MAISASEVLGCNDQDGRAVLSLDEKYFAVIINKICPLCNLSDESPKFERLVGRLVDEHKVDARHFICLADKEQAA